MKRAFIPEEKMDLNPTHINETSTSLKDEHLLSNSPDKQTIKLPRLKNITLYRKRIINMVILILGNIAVILLLLFLYYSL